MAADLVLVETMRACWRESHREAGNWGVWPQNGAERYLTSRAAAEAIADADDEGYDRIVRDARPGDVDDYEVR